MNVLERARSLLRAGHYQEVIALKPELLRLSGEELVSAHRLLLYAHLISAAGAANLHAALFHGRAILRLTAPGTLAHMWALEQMASAANLLRLPLVAERYAKAFLRQVPQDDRILVHVPYVWKHLGVAAAYRRRTGRAVQCLRTAFAGFERAGDPVQAAEVRLLLAWAYAEAGRARDAVRHLPDSVPAERAVQWHAIRALAALALNDVQTARQEALSALGSPQVDRMDGWMRAAYTGRMLLVLALVARAEGDQATFHLYIRQFARFEARQGRASYVRLVLAARGKGGDFLAPEASRGSGGYHPDARFTTGVG